MRSTQWCRSSLIAIVCASLVAACEKASLESSKATTSSAQPSAAGSTSSTESTQQHRADDLLAQLRREAEAGDPRGQNDLGALYQTGRGVERNDAEAVQWYRRAAERGYALAQSNLGFMYEHARGVAQDNAQALAWYQRAAQGGDANGQYHLALMYERGTGVQQDLVSALRWYEAAAKQGERGAAQAVARLQELNVEPAANAPSPSTSAPPAAPSVDVPRVEQKSAQVSAPQSAPVETSTSARVASPAATEAPQHMAPTGTVATPTPSVTAKPPAVPAATAVLASALPGIPVTLDNAYDGTGYTGTWHQSQRSTQRELAYRLAGDSKTLGIEPQHPFDAAATDSARATQPPQLSEALRWQFPRVRLRFTNGTAVPIRLGSLELVLQSTQATDDALVIIPSEVGAALPLQNIGWGKVLQPELLLGVAALAAYDKLDPRNASGLANVPLQAFEDALEIPLKQFAPERLRSAEAAVYGIFSYRSAAGQAYRMPFKTVARFDGQRQQRRWSPRYFHHVLLDTIAPQSSRTWPLDATLVPGRSAEIRLRIGARRSAMYQLLLRLKDASGVVFATQRLDARLLVPKYDVNAISSTQSAVTVAVQ